ncbi:class IV adenylate cyclase [Candidatus Dojkabacteria bacterium]|nr:class IV adenylate cyclase [Candidatus Dojkabacteria bacterium]
MSNTEIEKRFYVKNRNALIGRLKEKGKKIYENHQIDSYYTPSHRNFVEERYPFEWLRLREQNKKYILTYKHWYPERVKESTHCDEFETSISDKSSFVRIIEALDFKKIVTVDKLRLAYSIKGFEVSIDEVKELGTFVEIEIKSEYNSIDDAIMKIYELAKELKLNELPKNHPVRTGYPLPLYRKLYESK